MSLWLLLKVVVVLIFLVMFWRETKLHWGVGLLTVTTAFLLDIYLRTFGFAAAQENLGFFFYILAGGLFAGAAIWLSRWLWPQFGGGSVSFSAAGQRTIPPETTWSSLPAAPARISNTAFDRKMLYDQIRFRLGAHDLFDLLLDLQINENDVLAPNQTMAQLAVNVMDWAEQYGQTGALALAVERILTPPSADMLPRLEKLNDDSPPTVLRHYLLAHYSTEALWQMTQQLDIDWEQMTGGDNKRDQVRDLLLYLYRRNRINDLIVLLQDGMPS